MDVKSSQMIISIIIERKTVNQGLRMAMNERSRTSYLYLRLNPV